jgi:hypothetical protein
MIAGIITATVWLPPVLMLLAAIVPFDGSAAEARAVKGAEQQVLRVGPTQHYARPSQAARAARDGALVEIYSGDYEGDVAVWRQNDLTLRGAGERPHLRAAGRAAEGKAIWVIKGADITVENVEFSGARVPSLNGAGIRAEGRGLTVRSSAFLDNQMGILTNNSPDNSLVVEFSEFGFNGMSSGRFHHGLYAGRIGKLTVRFSYFHPGRNGHLLKSRAKVNDVRYSRFIDGQDGQASLELDFSEAGDVTVVGNVIDQAATSPNVHVISYAAEAQGSEGGQFVVAFNTILTRRRNTVFVANRSVTTGIVAFNVFAGAQELSTSGPLTLFANQLVGADSLVDSDAGDYRLVSGLPVASPNATVGSLDLMAIKPAFEPVSVTGARHRLERSPPTAGAFADCSASAVPE